MAQKKGCIPWNKGKKLTKKHRKNLSESHKGQIPWNKGTKKPKMKKGPARYWLGKKRSKEDKQKMSLGKLGKPYPKMSEWKKGRKVSSETRKKMSKAALKHMKNVGRSYLTPNIGKFEERILDNLELSIGYQILRQHKISSFFVDGYCKELNLVIEVNELYHHNKQKPYGMRREKEIKGIVNAQFLHIDIPTELIKNG